MKVLRACGALMLVVCASDHLVPAATAAVIFPTPIPTPSIDPCRFFTPRRTYVKASNTGAHDQFGGGADGAIALSADGLTLAVGVPNEDSNATGIGGNQADNSADASGAVYVFVRSALSAWTQQAYIKASNAQAEDEFGTSVALSADGSTLVVGAPEEDSNATGVGGDGSNNSATDLGAAYVFTRSGTTWTQQAYLKPWDIYQNSAGFGEAVDINNDGNRIAVGAPCASNCSGAVFLFGLGSSGWTTRVQIPAPSTYVATQFGRVVALSGQGGTLAVGAPFDDSAATGINGNDSDTSGHNTGSAYVYAHVVTPLFSFWIKQAYIKPADVDDGDTFGDAIALSDDGNVLAVGSPLEDGGSTGIDGDQSSESASGSGAAYVFARSGGTWTQQTYFKAANAETADQFGRFVALDGSGTVLAVSAVEEDSSARCVGGDAGNNGASASGAVYRFLRANGTWTQENYVKSLNSEVQDLFGFGLSISGTGNTLAAGAIGEDSNATGVNGNSADNSATWSGAAYVYGW